MTELVQVRERDNGSPATRHLLHQEKTTKSLDPNLGRFLRLLWQVSPRPLATRLEPEESLPCTLETILGCEQGEEESPLREHGNRPRERSRPRTLLLSPATASSEEPGNPLLSTGETSHQVDSFPAPLPFPPKRPEPPEEEEKGALPLRLFLFLPDWTEGEEVEDCF